MLEDAPMGDGDRPARWPDACQLVGLQETLDARARRFDDIEQRLGCVEVHVMDLLHERDTVRGQLEDLQREVRTLPALRRLLKDIVVLGHRYMGETGEA